MNSVPAPAGTANSAAASASRSIMVLETAKPARPTRPAMACAMGHAGCLAAKDGVPHDYRLISAGRRRARCGPRKSASSFCQATP